MVKKIGWKKIFFLIVISALTLSSLAYANEPQYFVNEVNETKNPDNLMKAYFEALYSGSNLTGEEMGYAGGTLGGLEPYSIAYEYWSREWKDKNSYDDFLKYWESTANVELLKLIPISENDGEHRYFVEIKTIEAIKEKKGFGIFYYSGYFTVENTKDGYKITDGQLEIENIAWEIGGHQPWKADPKEVARVALGGSIDDTTKIETEEKENGSLVVKFLNKQGKAIAQVGMVQRMDSLWEVLWKFSS